MIMTLDELVREHSLDFRVLASDISTRVLDKCRQGVYDAERLEAVPSMLRERYFNRSSRKGHVVYQVKDALRRLVVVRRINLSAPPYPLHGPLDCIFCRNVMIYFDDSVRRLVLTEMFRLLKPGGYLMVGQAESLTGLMSDFRAVAPSIYVKA